MVNIRRLKYESVLAKKKQTSIEVKEIEEPEITEPQVLEPTPLRKKPPFGSIPSLSERTGLKESTCRELQSKGWLFVEVIDGRNRWEYSR